MENKIAFPYSTTWSDKFPDGTIDDFEICVLYQPTVKQIDDFIVFYKNKNNCSRVGWIFPISRFDNTEYKDNKPSNQNYLEAFMSAARDVIYRKYKTKIDNYLEKEELNEITLGNFFAEIYFESSWKESAVENILILILYNPMVKKLDFSINNSKVFFNLKYNLFFLDEKSENVFNNNFFKKIEENSILVPTINQFTDGAFIFDILPTTYQKSYDNMFLKFSVLYQVIEFFIDDLVEKLIPYVIKNKSTTYDLKNTLNEKLSEKGRIKELFTNCVTFPGGNDLRDNLNNEVDVIKSWIGYNKDLNELEKQIYFLRNTIYHNLRTVIDKESFEERLKNINEIFEDVIYNMIATYNCSHYDIPD